MGKLRSDIHQEVIDAEDCKFLPKNFGSSDGSDKMQITLAKVEGDLIAFVDFWDKDGKFQGFKIMKDMSQDELNKLRNRLKDLE